MAELSNIQSFRQLQYTAVYWTNGKRIRCQFQQLINYTLTSGKFANSIFKNWEAVGAWFANGFIDLCLDKSYVTYCSAASYCLHWRSHCGGAAWSGASHDMGAEFLCSPPPGSTKPVPFERAGIGLCNMWKSDQNCKWFLRYMRLYVHK